MTRHFEGGVSVNQVHKTSGKYLRISAGPQRDMYVHILVMEAAIGRKLEAWETVEHKDGNGLNCSLDNLAVVTRPENTRLMNERRRRERERANAVFDEVG